MDFSNVKILKRDDYSVHIRNLITNESTNFVGKVIAVKPEGANLPNGFAGPESLEDCDVSQKDELREVLPKYEPGKFLTKDECHKDSPNDEHQEDLPEDGTKLLKFDDEDKIRKAESAEKDFKKKSTLPVLEHISPLLSTFIEKSCGNNERMSHSIRILRENGMFGNSELFGYLTDSRDFLVIGCIGLQGVGKSTIMSSLSGHSTLYNPQKPIFGIQKTANCDHQTCGMDVFITKNGVFLLDTPPIISPSSMKRLILQEYRRKHNEDYSEHPLITEQLSTTSENATELHSLRMAAFVLSVCHVVLLVQDWFFDPNVIRFLKSAEMLKPRKIDVTKLKHLTEHFPHIVFVQNKASLSQYTPDSITMMQTVYGKCFEKSNLIFGDNICNLEDTDTYMKTPNSYGPRLKKEEFVTTEYSSVNVWVLPKFEDRDGKMEKPDNADEGSDDSTFFDESEEESDDTSEQWGEQDTDSEQTREQMEQTQEQMEQTREQTEQIRERTEQFQERMELMQVQTEQTRKEVEKTRNQMEQTREQDEYSNEEENEEESSESRSEEDKESSTEEDKESSSEEDEESSSEGDRSRSTESVWETTDFEEETDDEMKSEKDYTDDERESEEETEDEMKSEEETEDEMKSEEDTDDEMESEGSIQSIAEGADKIELEAAKIIDKIENETDVLERNIGKAEGTRVTKNSFKNNLFVRKCLSIMMKSEEDIYEGIARLFDQRDNESSSVLPSDDSAVWDVIYEGIARLFAQCDDDHSSVMSSDESDHEENADTDVVRDFDYWISKLGDELKTMERNKLGCAMLSEKACIGSGEATPT